MLEDPRPGDLRVLALVTVAASALALARSHSSRTGAPEGLEVAPPHALPTTALARGEALDLNTASAAELELLPHVGPALAARIVADRARRGDFHSVAELARVRGVGPKTLSEVARLVEVRPPPGRDARRAPGRAATSRTATQTATSP